MEIFEKLKSDTRSRVKERTKAKRRRRMREEKDGDEGNAAHESRETLSY